MIVEPLVLFNYSLISFCLLQPKQLMTIDLGMTKIAITFVYENLVVTNLREISISEYSFLFLGFINIPLPHIGLRRYLRSDFDRQSIRKSVETTLCSSEFSEVGRYAWSIYGLSHDRVGVR